MPQISNRFCYKIEVAGTELRYWRQDTLAVIFDLPGASVVLLYAGLDDKDLYWQPGSSFFVQAGVFKVDSGCFTHSAID